MRGLKDIERNAGTDAMLAPYFDFILIEQEEAMKRLLARFSWDEKEYIAKFHEQLIAEAAQRLKGRKK